MKAAQNRGKVINLQMKIEQACGVNLSQCYECGKCSGGCSTNYLMEYTPRKIIQLIKMGREDVLLKCDTLWVCVGCSLCADRCPSGINIPGILDYLREKAYQHGVKPKDTSLHNILVFHELMLEEICKNGRVNDALLALKFNLRTRQYLKDAGLGCKLFFKGKINPLPVKIKDLSGLRRLFPEKSAPGKG